MANVLIVAYLLIVVALIGVILIQRSEGGGLGIGSSSTGLISVRGSANLLTRTTAILAALFFATAIGLTILSELDRGTQSILDLAADSVGEGTESTPTNVLDALNALNGDQSLNVPATDTTAPATDAPPADPSLAVPTTAPATTDTTTPATETPAAPTETPAAPAN